MMGFRALQHTGLHLPVKTSYSLVSVPTSCNGVVAQVLNIEESNFTRPNSMALATTAFRCRPIINCPPFSANASSIGHGHLAPDLLHQAL